MHGVNPFLSANVANAQFGAHSIQRLIKGRDDNNNDTSAPVIGQGNGSGQTGDSLTLVG